MAIDVMGATKLVGLLLASLFLVYYTVGIIGSDKPKRPYYRSYGIGFITMALFLFLGGLDNILPFLLVGAAFFIPTMIIEYYILMKSDKMPESVIFPMPKWIEYVGGYIIPMAGGIMFCGVDNYWVLVPPIILVLFERITYFVYFHREE